MCGIFGIVLPAASAFSYGEATATLTRLYQLSESRGKESAGLHLYFPNERKAFTLKGAQPASELLASSQYRDLTAGVLRKEFTASGNTIATPAAVLAHSRLVTNGTAALPQNNQPVRWGGVSVIHNGIIVNVDQLWAIRPELQRTAEVDTEVVAAYIADELEKGRSPPEATSIVFGQIKGAASLGWVHDASGVLVLATNTGDLYYYRDVIRGITVFASERYILDHAIMEFAKDRGADAPQIEWIEPGRGVVVELELNTVTPFDMTQPRHGINGVQHRQFTSSQHQDLVSEISRPAVVSSRRGNESLLRYNENRLRELKRCSCCVLPETFPFIEFDERGVCSYCRNYQPRYKGVASSESKQTFIDSLQHYRHRDGTPDALVAFSGGRDSSYGLHLIKKEFGLNPITFTYDWGMVTDLARRNIARMCGQLGVQNILVSADIHKKRDNIRKNVAAWLRRPDLGLVPLFMAGDKHFFSVVNTLKRQTGIRLDLWSANPLENTDFKSGFCGIAPDFAKKRLDYLSLGRKARLAAYYGIRFLTNPRYLNSSMLDTAGAFFSYYFEPRRDFYFIFNHMRWDEAVVNETLLTQYDWEISPDTKSTWRIGDGTASFYNYIYVTACGFSEFDTFRSNQIREGMLERSEALELVLSENRPRYESLQWYLDTINIDFDQAIAQINKLDVAGLHA